MRTIWQCEIDEWCQRILEKHWPRVKRYGDIRTVTADTAEPPDVFCAGFPCQPVSLAGKGLAQEDERWLWPECARIVGELRPRWVVLENVPGLLGRGMSDVLGDLAALGYDAEWDCVRASDFGAPHKRERVWIVAYPSGESGRLGELDPGGQGREATDPREPTLVRLGDGESSTEGLAARSGAGHVADAAGERRRQERSDRGRRGKRDRAQGRSSGFGERGDVAHPHGQPKIWTSVAWKERDPWPAEPQVGRVVDGFPGRVAQIRGLGNALVPQIAQWIGEQIVNHETATRAAANTEATHDAGAQPPNPNSTTETSNP